MSVPVKSWAAAGRNNAKSKRSTNLSWKEKLERCNDFNEQRYRAHNPNDEGRTWSLITHFRFDEDVIS